MSDPAVATSQDLSQDVIPPPNSAAMLSQCSSLNAVGWYVPLLYSSALATERLQLHPLAKPFCCGLFCLSYNLGYELNGASHQWWFWADGLQLFAPMWTLPGGTAHILDMGERVSAALEERWMRMPLMAPAFSAALGFGLSFGASLADGVLKLRPKRSAGWLVGFVSKVLFFIIAGVVGVVAAAGGTAALLELPVRALAALDIGKPIAVGALPFAMAVPVLALPSARLAQKRDWLLFTIPFAQVTHGRQNPWTDPPRLPLGQTPPRTDLGKPSLTIPLERPLLAIDSAPAPPYH